MSIRNVSIVGISLCSGLLFAYSAHAQFGLPGSENALSIAFSPSYPGPGETVTLTVKSPVIDISQSSVLWRAGGKTIREGKGADSAEVRAGALGVETTLEVSVTSPGGTLASANAVIIPTELDLLVDSDSYIPPFYKGGARPSAGTVLHLEASPRFKRGGVFVRASELVYTWRRNGEVMGNISGRGRSSVRIPAPHLFGTDTISVEARSDDGVLSRIESISLSSTEPVLTLHENHPLFGILYHRALGASTFIPESEMTFVAVPFFVQADSLNDPLLNFAWQVNGARVAASKAEPGELTINAENSSGRALVGVEVTHATNFYLQSKGQWNITFSTDASEPNQFRSFSQ